MAITWKLVLDIVLTISIIGTVLFLAFLEQKEIYLYTNLALLSVLCFLYWLYISSIRMTDLMRWLEKNKPSDRPCVKFCKRKLKDLLTAELPYWSFIYLHLTVTCMFYLYIPTIMAITCFLQDSTSPTVCAVLCVVDILYVRVIKKYISEFKMRFRTKYHIGSLLMLIGTFLLFSNFCTMVLLIGDIITVVGLTFHYDVYKQHFYGGVPRVDTIQQVAPVCNGDAAGRPQNPLTFFERFRSGLWRSIVTND